MKRTIITIIAAAVAMAAVSCNKEISNPQAPRGETLDISVSALMPEYSEGVKSELVNTMRVSWKNGDVIYVYDGTQCLGSLVASLDGDEDRYALLSTDDSHTVKEPAAGTDVLTLVYSPLLTEAPSVARNSISVSLAAQNTPKAPFVVFATLDYSGTSIANALVPFRFATSVIRVNCTGLNANTAITSANLNNVNTVCKLSLSGSTAPTVTGETNGTLTRTNDTYFAASEVNGEGEAVFQIAVPALEAASNVREFTVKQDSDKFVYNNFTKKALGAATSVNTVCQLKKLIIPAGALLGVFTVNDNGTPNDPSDDKQVHFSQGNLYWDGSAFKFEANQYSGTSYANNHVSHFYWSKDASVAYAEEYNDGSASGSDVFFTNETETTSKDGFTVNVGGTEQTGWRTLSTAEWTYLFNNHTKKWASVNGMKGYVIAPDGFEGDLANSYANDAELVTAGNLVFLPAAGYRSGSDVYPVGVYGYYWSSTATDWGHAYHAYFNSSGVTPAYNFPRNNGFSVRLITESK